MSRAVLVCATDGLFYATGRIDISDGAVQVSVHFNAEAEDVLEVAKHVPLTPPNVVAALRLPIAKLTEIGATPESRRFEIEWTPDLAFPKRFLKGRRPTDPTRVNAHMACYSPEHHARYSKLYEAKRKQIVGKERHESMKGLPR